MIGIDSHNKVATAAMTMVHEGRVEYFAWSGTPKKGEEILTDRTQMGQSR